MSTLQSLPAVGVVVGPLPAAADALSIDEADLMDFVETLLKRNQVPTTGEEGLGREAGQPVLEVTLLLGKVRGVSYLYAIDLELSELVIPVRPLESLEEIPAVTWKRQSAGIANRSQTIFDALEKMVEDFAAEYDREN
jgi:hypothetical protein